MTNLCCGLVLVGLIGSCFEWSASQLGWLIIGGWMACWCIATDWRSVRHHCGTRCLKRRHN